MKHGAAGYQSGGCRCDVCAAGNREHKAKWREKRRQAGKTTRGASVYPRHRNLRQWPLEDLLAVVPDARARLRVDTVQWRNALDHGMSDKTADTWSVRCGVHPGNVWAEWFDRGLTPLDDIAVNGSPGAVPGWRQAYEWSEAG